MNLTIARHSSFCAIAFRALCWAAPITNPVRDKLPTPSVVALGALLVLLVAPPTYAVKIGAMGDSLSDEYFEQTYGAYSRNWTVQLVDERGVDMGPIGTWGGPRRNGYEYNWARSGATTSTLLADGQHTGLAGQVASEGLDYAVMMIGANDEVEGYPGPNPYQHIANGTWTPVDISNWVSGVVNNIDTALATVVPTGVKTVLFGVPDYGYFPLTQSIVTDPASRQAVQDVLSNQLNPQIEALAQSYDLPYVDFLGALDAIFGSHDDLNSTLTIGNVPIYLQNLDDGSDPTAGYVEDGVHPNTTLQGIFANLVMEALNVGYDAELSLFSEEEILDHAGIAYGGSDTLSFTYGSYVINYVPEPSSVALLLIGCAVLALPFGRGHFTF